MALAWIMAWPGITAAIASATSGEQERELFGAVDLNLNEEDMKTLDTLYFL